MRPRIGAVLLLAACSGTPPADRPEPGPAAERGFEPPVVTNAESPVGYPPELHDQDIEGTVVLRLFVDATGVVVPESTRVAEGSGYLELDSAALAGVAEMRFAPARRDGQPVGSAFLQPVQFRRPESANGS